MTDKKIVVYEEACQSLEDILDILYGSEEYYPIIYGNRDFARYTKPIDNLTDYEEKWVTPEEIIRYMEAKTGQNWMQYTIRGCVQSEWQNVYYPTDLDAAIDDLEAFYFTGGVFCNVYDNLEDAENRTGEYDSFIAPSEEKIKEWAEYCGYTVSDIYTYKPVTTYELALTDL